MQADFVPFGDDPPLLVTVKSHHHCRHEEGRRHRVAREYVEYPGHAGATAVLSPRQAADRLTSVSQLAAFVIGVEGERNCTARVVFPRCRARLATGTNAVADPQIARLRPPPRLLRS